MGLVPRLLTNLRHIGLSLVLAAVLVAIASSGVYVAGAPRIVSLLVEPVSLFLMPGLLVALAIAGAHDFSSQTVVLWSLVLYAILFFLVLRRRALARAAHTSR